MGSMMGHMIWVEIEAPPAGAPQVIHVEKRFSSDLIGAHVTTHGSSHGIYVSQSV